MSNKFKMLKINKLFFLIAFLISLVFFSFSILYLSDKFMISLPQVIDSKTNNSLNLTNKSYKILKVFEILNPLKNSIALSRFKLPVLDIIIKREDIIKIEKNIESNIKNSKYSDIFKFDYLNKSVDGKLKVNNQTFDIDLKLHGTASAHFVNPKKSFKIKMTKKNETYFENMKSFNLIIPKELSQVAILGNVYLPSLLAMPVPKIFPVILNINNKTQGLYYLEEHLTKEFLEKTKRSGFDVITGNDDMGHQYSANHSTPFSGLIANTDFKNFSGLQKGQISKFKKLMNAKTFNEFSNLLNLDDFAKFQAINAIIFDYGHSSAFDNLRLLYDTSNGKFSPYIRIESKIENMYSSNAQTIDEGLAYSNNIFGLLSNQNHFIYKVTLNKDFRKLRNKYLYELILKKNEILKYSQNLINEHNKYIYADTTNNLPSRKLIKERSMIQEKIQHNFNFAERYLNYSRLFIEIQKKQSNTFELKIIPDSNDNLKFKKFKIRIKKNENLFKKKYLHFDNNKTIISIENERDSDGEYFDISSILNTNEFLLNLDEDLSPILNSSKFVFKFDDALILESVEVDSYTEITKKETLKFDIYKYVNNSVE